MKSRDSYDLFEVFKPGYMADANFFQKLTYWLKSVYWYHYKKHTLVALFGIILLIVFVFDMANREYYDLSFIVGGSSIVASEAMASLGEEIKAVIPDADGNGEINVNYQMLYTGTAYDKPEEGKVFDEMLTASIQKIQISFADDDVLLYILDKSFADWYAAEGAFEPLESFGISSDNRFCVRVDQGELFLKLGIENPDGWYAGIKVKNESRTKDETALKKYEAAVTALKIIME